MASEDTLIQIFVATLSADKAVREQAEAALTELSTDPKLVPQLIYFACRDLRQVGPAAQVAQQAAAIRVRNVVGRSDWNRQPYFTDDVKTSVRECIVPQQCSSHVSTAVCRQLLDTTRELITYDYPASWPTLMPQLMAILDECVGVLGGNEHSMTAPLFEAAATRLRAALGVLLACCKYYDNPISVEAEAVDDFVDCVGPSLVSLAELLSSLWVQELLQRSQMMCDAGELLAFEISPIHTVITDCLRIVLKCFHRLTNSRWPRFLCEKVEMERFCQVCVIRPSGAIHSTLLPLYRQRICSGGGDDEGDLFDITGESAVWKFVKWVTQISYQLVHELMFPKKCESRARLSAKYFCENILLQLVQQAVELIRWHASPRTITSKAYILSLEIITFAVEHSVAYRQIISPIAEELLTQLLFPRLAFSSSDSELWSSNPMEYVRRQTDPQGDMYSARVVSGSLILALTVPTQSFHNPSALTDFMHFVVQKLSAHSGAAAKGEMDASRVVDACLFTIYQFGGMLNIAGFPNDKVEWLLMEYVVPTTTYPVGILRARGMLVLSVLAHKVKWGSSQAYQRVVSAVLPLLQDSELPVRIQTCTAFAPLICHPLAHDTITPCIGEIIEHYFSAMRVMDSEGVVRTLRKTIGHYRSTLSRWALQLTDVLARHFEEILGRALSAEHTEAVLDSLDVCGNQKGPKAHCGVGEDVVSDSIMAADEVLGTLVTLVRSLPPPQVSASEVQPDNDLLLQIQQRIAPMLFTVLAQEGGSCFGFMDAALMLLTTVLSKSTAVSSGTWRLLLCLYQLVLGGSVDYFSQMLPPLDNFVSVSPQEFLSSPMAELCEVPAFASAVSRSTPAQVVSLMCDTVLQTGNDLRLTELAAVPKIYDSVLQNLWLLKQKDQRDGKGHTVDAGGFVLYSIQTALRVLNDPSSRQEHRRTFTTLFVNTIFSAILADTEVAVSVLLTAGFLTPLFSNYVQLVQGEEMQAMLRSYDRRLFVMAIASLMKLITDQRQQVSSSVDETLCGVLLSGILTSFTRAEGVMAVEEMKRWETDGDENCEWSDDDAIGDDEDDELNNFEDDCGDDDDDDEEEEWENSDAGSDDNLDVAGMKNEGRLQTLLVAAAAARKSLKDDNPDDNEEENLLDETDFISPIDTSNAWSLLLTAVNECSLSATGAGTTRFIEEVKSPAAKQLLATVQEVGDIMTQLMVLRESRKKRTSAT